MNKIALLIATHKKYWLPSNPLYFPIHVGAEGKDPLGLIGDNTGNNISKKNPDYCELTGFILGLEKYKDRLHRALPLPKIFRFFKIG